MPRLKIVPYVAGKSPPLTDKAHLSIYRTMVTSRRLDDLEIQLKQQNRVFFQISGAGHEATCTIAATHLDPKRDWFFPYYRDRALCLGLGVTPHDMLLQSVGAAADPASGGRQMPSHWGSAKLNIVSQSSPTGTQYLHAVGCAEAGVRARAIGGDARDSAGQKKGGVVYVSSGEGATSEGEFLESLNTACNLKLPVVFHIQDNGYAISVPVEVQTAGGSISQLCAGYPNLLILEFDGCNLLECHRAWKEGVAYARAQKGPVLMHAHVVRPYAHSMSDDDRLYRTQEELQEDQRRDPLTSYRKALCEEHGISEKRLNRLETTVATELLKAREVALTASPPSASRVMDFVYSEDVDPTSQAFATEPHTEGADQTMVNLVNVCLRDEMDRDARVLVFGQDVADVSREKSLEKLKGKGGVFKATAGLQRKFGSDRVFNTPLAEANIIGRAIGMALRGLKPVVEIQFFDYIYPAMMQIKSELTPMRWRSNNHFKCPVVIRSTYGGYLKGGAVYHSQTGESIFAHIPGLRVVLPSNARDANGLLRTAIRCDDPVLFLEHKHLYRQTYNRAPYPGPDFMIPFGCAAQLTAGTDITLITYGALVKRSMDAVKQAKKRGISVEVLDLRTISPYDWDSISKSVCKTNRALVVYEDSRSWGSGSEIAARISDELFDFLDAPVRRVASLDAYVGYHPNLENETLPQISHVLSAIEDLASY